MSNQLGNNVTSGTIKDNILVGQEITIPGSTLNVGNLILESLESNSDIVGQIEASTGKQCTYTEMRERSIRCALWLEKQGVKPGDVVGIFTCCHFDSYIPFFASFYIGAICAPEYHKLTKRDMCNFLTTLTPKVIFLHDYSVETLTDALKELNMEIPRIIFEDETPNEMSLEHILSMQTSIEVNEFRCTNISNPDEPALLLSTSGTTGTPKIAVFSHYALRALSHPSYAHYMRNQVYMCISGLRWIPSIICIFGGLSSKATRILVPDCQDAKFYCQAIKQYKVEYYFADSNQIREVFKLNLIDEYRSTNLKTIVFGGSAFARNVHATLVKLLPEINVFHIYGSTELGNTIACQGPNCQPGSCGYVVAGVKIRIVSTETGETLGPNKEGELRVKAPTQICDYWKNTETFKKSIDSEGWYCTSDIGYYDENGEVYISGRFSQFIKYRDCRLSGPYGELVLEEHPAVYKAAVIGIPAEVEGELPVAVVIKMPDKEVTEKELINHFESNLPDYYKLYSVKFIDKFPHTLSGKIAKNKLKEMVINGVL